MPKKYLYLLFAVLFGMTGTMNAQDYAVQVAAYSDPVPMETFKNVPGVYLEKDHNNIYRYYLGPFVTEDFAQKNLLKARNAGFEFSRVVNMTEIRELCKRSCSDPGDATFTNIDNPTPAPVSDLFVKNIFFDFDRSFLRDASTVQLDKLHSILSQNPSYSAELHAHTDALGSHDYNVALSKRRGNKTKNYLVKKGITGSRLDVQVYGEDRPVAKNATVGGDSPEGRQLNRRVEIRIVDQKTGQIIWDMVEVIAVPDNLRID